MERSAVAADGGRKAVLASVVSSRMLKAMALAEGKKITKLSPVLKNEKKKKKIV